MLHVETFIFPVVGLWLLAVLVLPLY